MKTITLTKAQKSQIMASLAKYHEDGGRFDIDIDIDGGITVRAQGTVEIETEKEDDYFNGTGACIETSRWAEVTLTAFKEDGEVELDKDIEREVEEYLNAA